MRKWLIVALALLLQGPVAQAEGMQVGVGVFALARDGADIQLSYRAPQSHYRFGYRCAHWTDVFHDPFTRRAHSSTTHTLAGPVLTYLLRPEENSSFYAGASLLKWTRKETPLITADPPGSNATTDLYLGGGYSGLIASRVYYNLGTFIAPGARLNTQTAISSEESSGNFDIQLQLGLAF